MILNILSSKKNLDFYAKCFLISFSVVLLECLVLHTFDTKNNEIIFSINDSFKIFFAHNEKNFLMHDNLIPPFIIYTSYFVGGIFGSKLSRIGGAMYIAGWVGNSSQIFIWGYVIDWIGVRVSEGKYLVSNVPDLFLDAGMRIFFISFFLASIFWLYRISSNIKNGEVRRLSFIFKTMASLFYIVFCIAYFNLYFSGNLTYI